MSPCTLRTSKHGCHDNATATASSGLLIQDPTRNLGLIVCVTFFSFSTAKWTSFAMKFISALSLVLVLFHPEPSGNPGPPTAFPDGHVFYYPVKHYTQVLWYWFIYLFVSVPQALVRDVFVLCVGNGAFERIKYIAGICSRPLARQVIVSEPRAPADTTTNVSSLHAGRLKPFPEEKRHSRALFKPPCGWRVKYNLFFYISPNRWAGKNSPYTFTCDCTSVYIYINTLNLVLVNDSKPALSISIYI